MKFAYTLIYVPDVEMTLNFYVKTFGCTIRFIHESKCYGELATEGVVLAFANEAFVTSGLGTFETNDIQKNPAGFEIAFTTENVQQAYEHAINAGALPLQPPTEKPWGQVVSYVRDINGVIVEICSVIS